MTLVMLPKSHNPYNPYNLVASGVVALLDKMSCQNNNLL